MTREDAVKELSVEYFGDSEKIREAKKMAIKALSAEPCEDCISRAEAIEALGYDISIESDEGLDAYKTVIKEMLCKIYDVQKENIEKLPSVQPKPKTGHWIDHQEDRWIYAQCSECGTVHDTQTNYCPNCGAKMESEDTE